LEAHAPSKIAFDWDCFDIASTTSSWLHVSMLVALIREESSHVKLAFPLLLSVDLLARSPVSQAATDGIDWSCLAQA